MSTVQRQVEISAAFASGSVRAGCAATPIPAPTRATADVKDSAWLCSSSQTSETPVRVRSSRARGSHSDGQGPPGLIDELVPGPLRESASSEDWSKALHISRFRLHALQKAKQVERTNGDQFEAHHMCFTQRQLFEHFVSDRRIGDVDDERHARLSL